MDDNSPQRAQQTTNADGKVDDLSPLNPTPQRNDEYGEIILKIHLNKRCQELRREKKEKMPKRNKKNKKKMDSKFRKSARTAATGTSPDGAVSSAKNFSETNCDYTPVEIELPRVQCRSSSLLGTFGLLHAQKPERKKIKQEPVEVGARDPLGIETNNHVGEIVVESCVPVKDLRVRTKEVRVVLEDIFNSVKISGVKEREYLINEIVKQNINNTIEEGVAKQRFTNANENVNNMIMKEKGGTDANDNMNRFSKQNTDANDNFVIIGDFCVDKDDEDIPDDKNQKNAGFKTASSFSAEKDKKDNNEMDSFVLNDKFPVEMEQEDNNQNVNVPNITKLPVEKHFSNDVKEVINQRTSHATENIVLSGAFSIKIEREDGLETVKCEEESDTNMTIVNVVSIKSESKQDFSCTLSEMAVIKQSANDSYELKSEFSVEKYEKKMLEIKSCKIDQEESSTSEKKVDVNKYSCKNGDDNLSNSVHKGVSEDFWLNNANSANAVTQNASLCNVNVNIKNSIGVSVERSGKSSLRNKNKAMALKENHSDEDVEILNVVCKICHNMQNCPHFPLIVE